MRALQNEHGHELRDCLALHIEGAAPPDVAVLNHATEWVHTPVFRRCEHDVHVIEKDHRSGAAVARQAGVEVGLPRGGLENSRLDTIAAQQVREPARRRDFVAGRIRRVDADVLRQQAGRFVAECLPILVAGSGDDCHAGRRLHHRCRRRTREGRGRTPPGAASNQNQPTKPRAPEHVSLG